MYGDGHGNINTGCYHSCSIDKARYLSAQELKEILARFKTRMENGDYDCVDHISPLLTEAESRHIEKRISAEQRKHERCREQRRQERLKKLLLWLPSIRIKNLFWHSIMEKRLVY